MYKSRDANDDILWVFGMKTQEINFKLKSFQMASDLALSYALLILVDAKKEVTEGDLNKLVTKVNKRNNSL